MLSSSSCLLVFILLFQKLYNQVDEARSEQSKEHRLRERAETYAKDLEEEIENVKRRQMGRKGSPDTTVLTQEIAR